MTTAPVSTIGVSDEERRARLVRMKRLALALLVGAAVIYMVAWHAERLGSAAWIGYVRATAEAALVGGLADWFAVTALFRHPLGLPIPHTAIIAARKDRIGQSLGAFVQNHFLSQDVVARKLTEGLAVFADAGHHQVLLDAALQMVADAVEENRNQIRERISAESPWWVPSQVDDAIYKRLVTGITHTLAEVQHDPAHPLRARFDTAFHGFIDRLQYGEGVLAVVEQYRSEVGALIAHTVASWDPRATSDRIELAIGRDLQFIRINGTIVGGLAGLIIHALTVSL